MVGIGLIHSVVLSRMERRISGDRNWSCNAGDHYNGVRWVRDGGGG